MVSMTAAGGGVGGRGWEVAFQFANRHLKLEIEGRGIPLTSQFPLSAGEYRFW